MRIAISCTLAALLAGCSVVPPQAWSFDPTRPPPKAALPMQEVVALTDRVAQLQLQRNEIRASIAAEPDIWKRQRLYGQLHSVGLRLSRLERQLGTIAAAR